MRWTSIYLTIVSNLIFFLSIKSIAQTPTWQGAGQVGGLNNENSVAIATDPISGSVYTTGMFFGTGDFDPSPNIYNLNSVGGDDIFIVKTDADCKFLWARSFGGVLSDVCAAMAIDPTGSGNVYLTGYFQGTVDFDPGPDTFNLSSKANADVFILALNGDGNFLWAHAIGGSGNDNGRAIKVSPTSNGNIYVVGAFQNTVDFDPGTEEANLKSNGSYDMFLLCLDYNGIYIWVKSIGGPGQDFGTSLAIDPTGDMDIVLLGGFGGTVDFGLGAGMGKVTSVGPQDIFIMRFTKNGDPVWLKTLGGLTHEYGTSLTIDPKNKQDICISGFFQGSVDFDPGPEIQNRTSNGNQDLFILKLDHLGGFKWIYTVGGIGVESSNSVAIDPSGSGDLFSTGYFQQSVDFDAGPDSFKISSAGSYDMFVIKLDSMGNYNWVKSIGGTSLETGSSIAVGNLSEVYVCGDFYSTPIAFDTLILYNTNSLASTSDVFIAKLNKSMPSEIADFDVSQINLYPNPASNLVHIKLSDSFTGPFDLKISDSKGNIIYSKNNIKDNSKKISIDISNLHQAIYFVEINTLKARMYSKFIKTY